MNPETGKIYRTAAEVEAARQRGEPLVELTPSFDARNDEFGETRRGRNLFPKTFNASSRRNRRKPVKK